MSLETDTRIKCESKHTNRINISSQRITNKPLPSPFPFSCGKTALFSPFVELLPRLSASPGDTLSFSKLSVIPLLFCDDVRFECALPSPSVSEILHLAS